MLSLLFSKLQANGSQIVVKREPLLFPNTELREDLLESRGRKVSTADAANGQGGLAQFLSPQFVRLFLWMIPGTFIRLRQNTTGSARG